MRILAMLWLVLCMGVLFFLYFKAIRRGEIKPTFTTWLLFSVASIGSLATYLGPGDHIWLDNFANAMDAVWTTILMVLVGTVSRENKSKLFKPFDLYCLALAVAIMVFWFLLGLHMFFLAMLQVIMVVAYIPMWKNLRGADDHDESLLLWGGAAIASSPLLYWHWLMFDHDRASFFYILRGTLSPAGTFVLLLVIEVKKYARRRIGVRSHP